MFWFAGSELGFWIGGAHVKDEYTGSLILQFYIDIFKKINILCTQGGGGGVYTPDVPPLNLPLTRSFWGCAPLQKYSGSVGLYNYSHLGVSFNSYRHQRCRWLISLVDDLFMASPTDKDHNRREYHSNNKTRYDCVQNTDDMDGWWLFFCKINEVMVSYWVWGDSFIIIGY